MADDREVNQSAFRRLKPEIDASYPQGRYLAIENGQIVADAATFEELDRSLARMGKDSPDILVVQAGHDYPESIDIFI